jgi:uncharacterized protein (TIGR03118 family)
MSRPFNPNIYGGAFPNPYGAYGPGMNPALENQYNNFITGQTSNPCANDPRFSFPRPQPRHFINPMPLKSFADPGLINTCATRPLIAPGAPTVFVSTFRVNYLVSNQADFAGIVQDDLLVNPWGIVIYKNQIWVANGGTDTITSYDIYGNKLSQVVSIRDPAQNSSYPSGIAVNCGPGFPVQDIQTRAVQSSLFLVATQHGTVHAFNDVVSRDTSYIVINEQLTGEITVYTGIAVANNNMYLADFFGKKIEVYDSKYRLLSGGSLFKFVDNDSSNPIPDNYGPFNIVFIQGLLYVLWAPVDITMPLTNDDGPHTGFVSVFRLDGSFVRRFTSGGALNAPWAMIPAPCVCGFPDGSFWIGNHGDGRINAFDCTGGFIGPVFNPSGQPIDITGLWGLAPYYGDNNDQVYFTAARNPNTTGELGNIQQDQIINIGSGTPVR